MNKVLDELYDYQKKILKTAEKISADPVLMDLFKEITTGMINIYLNHKDDSTKEDTIVECDRNICTSNEYNGINCDDCEVTKANKKASTETFPCTTCEYRHQCPEDNNVDPFDCSTYKKGGCFSCANFNNEPDSECAKHRRVFDCQSCDNYKEKKTPSNWSGIWINRKEAMVYLTDCTMQYMDYQNEYEHGLHDAYYNAEDYISGMEGHD